MHVYPVSPDAASSIADGGVMVAVRLANLVTPLRKGRLPGGGCRSALVIGGTRRIRTGEPVVFCKIVAVAPAQVRQDGRVQAKGSPVHHATLGPLEEWLEEQAGPGVIDGIAERAVLQWHWSASPAHASRRAYDERTVQDQTCVQAVSRAIRAAPGIVPVHDPDPVRGEQVRKLPHRGVQELLLRGGLVRAGRAVRHPQQPPRGGVRHRQPSQLRERGRVIPGADRTVHGPVRRRVRYPDQRPVDRPGLQRPVPADDHRPPVPLLMLGVRGAQHDVLQFLQRLRAERVPPVPERALRRRHPRPRPRHQCQRSPASAITASRTPAPGTSVISTMTRIMNPAASSRSRSPFTYSSRPGR